MSFNAEMIKQSITPIVLLSIDFATGTENYAAKSVTTSSAFYSGKVLSFGGIRRAMPSQNSIGEVSDITVDLDNADGFFSLKLDYDTGTPIKNRLATIKMGTEGMPLSDFQTIFAGKIDDYTLKNRVFSVTIKNIVQYLPEKPKVGTVTLTEYPHAHADALGKVFPWVYGKAVSVDTSVTSPNKFNNGAIECLYVDNTTGAYRFLIAGHAIKDIPSSSDDATKRDVYQITSAGVTKLPNANYTLVKSDGVDGRAYLVFSAASASTFTDAAGNLAKIRVNVHGMDSSHDSVGTLLENPVDVFEDMIANMLGLSGSDIDTGSFDDVRTVCDDRLYIAAGAYVTEQDTQSMLKDFAASFDMKIYTTKANKIGVHIFEPQIDTAGSEISEQIHILADSWNLKFGTDFNGTTLSNNVINKLTYKFNLHPALNDYLNSDLVEDATSQSRYGIQENTIEYKWTSDSATANDVATRTVFKTKYPYGISDFDLSLYGMVSELSELVEITHSEAPSSDGRGYQNRISEIFVMEYDLDNHKVHYECHDIDFLARQGFFLGSDGSDGNPQVNAADWTDATDFDKKYGYLCDESTGEFSNGDPGKALL